MHVEIWSDVACPWCYVGKRRFEAALARYEHAGEVTVTWRSFELDPGAPAERPGDTAAHLAAKYRMARERALELLEQMTARAAAEGLDFDFAAQRGGSTFDAHRLIHLAAAHGVQDAMKERLLRAYFSEGALVSDGDVLRRLAADVGLPAGEVEELLAGERFAADVRADEDTAADFGISGVPFFVVDRKIAASGAQEPEVFLELLRRARPEPAFETVPGGEACGPNGC
jgi:predicted DsbA family dithiol-disulfide isomerase